MYNHNSRHFPFWPITESTWKHGVISELLIPSFNQILFAQLSFLKIHICFDLCKISPGYLVWISEHCNLHLRLYRKHRHGSLHFEGRWDCGVLGWQWKPKLHTTYTQMRTPAQHPHGSRADQLSVFTKNQSDTKFLFNGGPCQELETSVHSSRQMSLVTCAVTGFVWSLGADWKRQEFARSEGWDNNRGFKRVSVLALHRRYVSQQPFGWLAPFLFFSYVLHHLRTRGVWYRDQAKTFRILKRTLTWDHH